MLRYSSGVSIARWLAEIEARAARFGAIEPEHLFVALTKLKELTGDTMDSLLDADQEKRGQLNTEVSELTAWFERAGLEPKRARRRLRRLVGRGTGPVAELHLSPRSRAVLEVAQERAREQHATVVTAAHLAHALIQLPSSNLEKVVAGSRSHHLVSHSAASVDAPKVQPAATGHVISRYGRNLLLEAQEGVLGEVVGRGRDIRQLTRTLCRRHRGHVLLIAESGVGATSLVEGVAWLLASAACPPALQGCPLVELSGEVLAAAVAGDDERRVWKQLLQEADSTGDKGTVVVIDRMHLLFVRDGDVGGPSAMGLLLPALERGVVKLVGIVPPVEARDLLNGSEGLARFVEPLRLEEPDREQAQEIIECQRRVLERHHGVLISAEAAAAAVELSLRFLLDRRLPKKAVELLDEACAGALLQSVSGRFGAGATEPDGVVPTVEIGVPDVAAAVAARRGIPPSQVLSVAAAVDLEQFVTAHLQRNRGADTEGQVRIETRGITLHSTMEPSVKIETALLVIDLVQSTDIVLDLGDSLFGRIVEHIRRGILNHRTAHALLFLKCTGDGFLAAYRDVSTALAVSRMVLERFDSPELSLRAALNYGPVRTGFGGDPLGVEVHRVFRMEGLQDVDRVDAATGSVSLPSAGRILATREALEQLDEGERLMFSAAGRFAMKGFREPCEMFVATEVAQTASGPVEPQ